MKKETKKAIHLLTIILANNAEPTFEGLRELYEIRSGNVECILEHLKALENIFKEAIEDFEENINGKD